MKSVKENEKRRRDLIIKACKNKGFNITDYLTEEDAKEFMDLNHELGYDKLLPSEGGGWN